MQEQNEQQIKDKFKELSEAHFFAFLENMQVAFNKFIHDRMSEYYNAHTCICPYCNIDLGKVREDATNT